jgi:hypothetical protein
MSTNLSSLEGSNDSWSAKKKDAVFLIVLLVGSLSLNVFLGWRVQRQNNVASNRPSSTTLSEGMAAPPIIMRDLNDTPQTITFTGMDKPTIVYVFSTRCSWCDRNLESLKTLVTLKGDSYRFIGLALIDTEINKYVNEKKLNFPVYKNLTPDTVRLYGLGATPQTIVISSDGNVMKNWSGAYGEKIQKEVEMFFDTQLPKISQAEASGGGCVYCAQDGLLYSPGAVIDIGDRKVTCSPTGKWVEF